MMKMKWNFPSNNGGEIAGLNGSVEFFAGSPLESLAREICQNSIDAKLPNRLPTKVVFDLFTIKKEEFPNRSDFEEMISLSLNFWKTAKKNMKTMNFFMNAENAIQNDEISVLRISDYNTTGLLGSDQLYNTPWCNLTKSSGISDKFGTAGGSYGLGKFAPYACSSLRTVFYSTRDVEGKEAFQGVSRLASFMNKDGDITTGVGYLGNDGNTPVFKQFAFNEEDLRKENESGSDVYILGFNHPDWKTSIVISILDSFFYAVYNGWLEVTIKDRDGTIVIDKNTMPQIFEDYVDENQGILQDYYDVLMSKDTIAYKDNFFGKGNVYLWLLAKEPANRKVAMIRKTGMKIKDHGGVSSFLQFAGVMYIEGEQLNKELVAMENPAHTKWEPARNTGHEKESRELLKALNSFIKDKVNLMFASEQSESFDPMIGDLLPMQKEDHAQGKRKLETLNDDIKDVQAKKRTMIKPVNKTIKQTEMGNDSYESEDGVESDGPSGSGHGNGKNSLGGFGGGDMPGKGPGISQDRKIAKRIQVDTEKIRIICINKEEGDYSIIITSPIDAADCTVKFYLEAESGEYNLEILEAKVLDRKQNCRFDKTGIYGVNLEKNKRIRVRVKFDFDEYCAMGVKIDGTEV